MANQITPTDGQVARVKTLVEDVIRTRSGATKDGIKQLLANGGAFQDRLIPIIQDLCGISPNLYEEERVNRSYNYPSGWTVPSFDEQRERTASLFPNLVLPEIVSRDVGVPGGWDGAWWFPPKIAALGRIWGVPDYYLAGYGIIVEQLLALIGQQRKLHNYRGNELTADHIRINEIVRGRIEALESATDGDFLPPMPITFGQFYGGFSPRNARETAIRRQELPFCTVQVGSLHAVMPERLVAYKNLFVGVPGDEYNWGAGGGWSGSLYFCFGAGKLKFDASDAEDAYGADGSVVGLPGALELAP